MLTLVPRVDVPPHDPGDGRDGAACAYEDYGGETEPAIPDLDTLSSENESLRDDDTEDWCGLRRPARRPCSPCSRRDASARAGSLRASPGRFARGTLGYGATGGLSTRLVRGKQGNDE